tara:strand:- start:324 stop:1202 length:879 start_codon:yes stop_codon:yes gene_type:complete
MKIEGVYTAMITPFTAEKEVDYEGFRKNVQTQISGGISGILPLGTTGETPTLSREEQNKIISIAVEEGKGKVTIMIGTGANSTKKTIENTNKAHELGAEVALVVTPYYNKPTQEGIYQHFKAVVEATTIPILVYNIQGRTGKNIETSTLKRIADLPRIVGVKEASGNVDQMMNVINQIGSETFSVMSGDDGLTMPLLALGGRGVVSVVSNLVPEQVVAMVKAGLQNDFVTARKLHYELLPLFTNAFIETNPSPIKFMMGLKGMPSGPVRLPLVGMSENNQQFIKNLVGDNNA